MGQATREIVGATAARWPRGTLQWAHRMRAFFTSDRVNSRRFIVTLWLLTRGAVIMLWLLFFFGTKGDVNYYFTQIERMFEVGPEVTMREYPTPVLWLLSLPYLAGLGTAIGYLIGFVAMMFALDVAFTINLWKAGGRLRGQAVLFWTLFILLVGPTAYLRFDLVTSVCAGWALLAVMKGHSKTGGAFIGIGAAVKLWPALMWPALCGGPRRQKLAATVGVFGVGGILALVSLLWAGWDRLLSPLGWQSGRGLQVESVWASVPMLLRGFGLGDYAVAISRYQAFEVWGTSVNFWMKLADLSFQLGLIWAVIAYLLWLRRGPGRLMEAVALILMVILLMIVANKTFSPQYVIWLGGTQAAAFAIMGNRAQHTDRYHEDKRRLKRFALAIAVMTLLTTIVYPIGYGPLVRDWGWTATWFRLPVTLVLVARNVLISAMFVWTVRWVWSFISPAARRRAADRERVGAAVEATL